ncbi:MAG: flagellar protein FlgN, partial [Planctomycetota bacterium]
RHHAVRGGVATQGAGRLASSLNTSKPHLLHLPCAMTAAMNETSDTVPFDQSTMPASIDDWEQPLTELLADLSDTQTALLDVLGRKRDLLAGNDRAGLAAIQPEEERLGTRLSECQQRRQRLLEAAGERGLPTTDLSSLTEAMPEPTRKALRPKIREARSRARILQHQSLTNWVLVQRTLLHLSQMIEIVATGGQKAPTYEKSGPSAAGGVLMDRAV